jgi:steroid 5-alpha reductase family enzyme
MQTLYTQDGQGATEPLKPQPIDFWLPIVVVFGFNMLFGIWCQYKVDNSYIDVVWGLTFVWPAIALIVLRLVSETMVAPDLRCYLTFAMILIWALRLAYHIGARHTKEDFRYVEMREAWTERGGKFGYYWRAFVYVFGF